MPLSTRLLSLCRAQHTTERPVSVALGNLPDSEASSVIDLEKSIASPTPVFGLSKLQPLSTFRLFLAHIG